MGGSLIAVVSSSPSLSFSAFLVIASWPILLILSLWSILADFTLSPIASSFSSFSSFPALSSSVVVMVALSALISLLLSLFPGFLGEEVALDVERRVVAGLFFLFCSGFSGERDFEDGQKSLISDGHKSLFRGLININNLPFGDGDDLVKALHLSSHDFCDPESPVHESFSSLDCNKTLAFTEEKSESSGDVFAQNKESSTISFGESHQDVRIEFDLIFLFGGSHSDVLCSRCHKQLQDRQSTTHANNLKHILRTYPHVYIKMRKMACNFGESGF